MLYYTNFKKCQPLNAKKRHFFKKQRNIRDLERAAPVPTNSDRARRPHVQVFRPPNLLILRNFIFNLVIFCFMQLSCQLFSLFYKKDLTTPPFFAIITP